MSNMLNRFVKIIEQVDPEQQQQLQRQQQQNNNGDNIQLESTNDNDQNFEQNNPVHEHHAINVAQNNNLSGNPEDEAKYDNRNNNQQHREEITDYDISDPFVAEYNHHNNRSSATTKKRDDEQEYANEANQSASSPLPILQNSMLPVSGSPMMHSSVSAQHQYDKFIDSASSASHYLNYLNRSGNFDLATAVESSDVKVLLERIAVLESAIIQSNYERQVLQCRLENNNNDNNQSGKHEIFNNNNNEDTQATHQENLRRLRQSLVEQIEKNDALLRDFQGRVVQLEYDLVVARKKQKDAETKTHSISGEKEAGNNHRNLQTAEMLKEENSEIDLHQQQQQEQQNEKMRILEAKLLDAQKKNDLMQRKAAEALQKSTSRETTIQQELEFVQKELLETRKRLIEAQKPIDHQLEDQLKKTQMFEKINAHTSWGTVLANTMGGIDRCGVRIGRFFANHAMIRFFFLVYVICLHIYIFHLFAAVLHHMETTSDDVHQHLSKINQQNDAGHR